MKNGNGITLIGLYDTLYRRMGPSGWWPAKTKFEVMVGAILTQNAAWANVEKAIANLRRNGLLNVWKIDRLKPEKLAGLIRPAGYFNVKSRRLKALAGFLISRYGGSIRRMSRRPLYELRAELLEVNGVGEETADSILLYALNKPIFVVDAYTKRVLSRHGLIDEGACYEDVQNLFMRNIKHDAALFNEYHALIVRLAKDACRAKPRCDTCSLRPLLKRK